MVSEGRLRSINSRRQRIIKNSKLLNIKCNAASVSFISAIWTTFLLGYLGSTTGKDAGLCSDRRCRRIGQSLHGVGSTPGKSTYCSLISIGRYGKTLMSCLTTLKQHIFSVNSTSKRWINAESTLFQRCVPAGACLVNVCSVSVL